MISKIFFSKKISAFLAISICLVALALFFFNAPKANASVLDWQKSVTIYPNGPNDFSSSDFRRSLSNAANMNINHVTVAIPIYQSSNTSSDIQTGRNTPTDQSLIDAINHARSLNIRIAFKIHLSTFDTSQWGAFINAANRDEWFGGYQRMLNRYGAIAESHRVEVFIIGNELITMATATSNPDNTQRWSNMINSLRSVYSGSLSYNSNWGGSFFSDEKNHIEFWKELDFIGISAYFNLNDDFRAAWDNYNRSDIQTLHQRYGKDIVFTEVGYKSTSGARFAPWDWGMDHGVNQREQAEDYEALFAYWNDFDYIKGMHIWNWEVNPNAGGQSISYTPQNKLAQEVITRWFGNTGQKQPPPPPPPPPVGTPRFSAVATAEPLPVTVNQQLNFSANVSNTGQYTLLKLVDFEIYTAAGQKVFQRFFNNETFAAGQTKNYSFSWSPAATGNYVLKTGIFSNEWAINYYWNNNLISFNVNERQIVQPPPPPPPPPGKIDIWWPTGGTAVSGVQPFKALLTNYVLNTYMMYWQVDGGQLNLMENSSQDWPHKDSLVDLSGWRWRGNGPYVVNFVAKDSSGRIIAQRSVTINIAR